MSYLSAKELGIEPWIRDGMVELLQLFEAGQMKYISHANMRDICDLTDYDLSKPRKFSHHFNMSEWNYAINDCGSVACLGGSIELMAGRGDGAIDARNLPKNIYELFFPNCDRAYEDITTYEAEKALRNVLVYGEPRWPEVLGEPRFEEKE